MEALDYGYNQWINVKNNRTDKRDDQKKIPLDIVACSTPGKFIHTITT